MPRSIPDNTGDVAPLPDVLPDTVHETLNVKQTQKLLREIAAEHHQNSRWKAFGTASPTPPELYAGQGYSCFDYLVDTIYARDSGVCAILPSNIHEILTLLAKMFRVSLPVDEGINGVLEALNMIEDTKRLTVHRITRVENRKRNAMYAACKQQYKLGDGDEIDVVHGSDQASVMEKIKNGIRGGPMRQGALGNGLYVSRYPEVAASSAAPGPHDGLQALLACKMLKGPTATTAVCTDEVDKDEHGRTILTRQSPHGQWLCARFEDQLKVVYRVDVRLVLSEDTARDEAAGKLPWLHGEVRRELHQVFACKKKGKRPAVRVPMLGAEVQVKAASGVQLGTKKPKHAGS